MEERSDGETERWKDKEIDRNRDTEIGIER
jgi:hypothetical protein